MPPSLLSLLSFHLAQPNVYATFSPDSSEPLSHLEMATLASRCLWPTTASSSIFLPGTYFRGKCRFSKASRYLSFNTFYLFITVLLSCPTQSSYGVPCARLSPD